MSEGEKSIEMANLICRFGDKVLLDHFDEIVYPSFTDEELIRKYGDTRYFFESVELIHLESGDGNDVVGLAGRFIKDTQLKREQIYVQGEGLKRAPRTMQSSPSSLFLLVLNSHRLVYLKETVDGPNKDAFRSTLLSFLKKKHAEILKKKLDAIDEQGLGRDDRSEAKDEVREEFKRPTLELVALTSEESIEDFIRGYEILKQIRISFADRNDESDLDEFFEQLQKAKDSIGSSDTALVHKSKEGLDKDEAVQQVAAATSQGNQTVTLRGLDESGETIIGNNERFQLKTPIDNISDIPSEAAQQMYESFSSLVERGLVKLPVATRRVSLKIKSVLDRYFE